MSNIVQLKLLEGEFNVEEAKEILLNVFSEKIKFHERKNFSSHLRFGKDHEPALKRIEQLKKSVEEIREIVAGAEADHKKLMITSTINITLIDP